MGILDHIGFAVTDIARSRAFYEQALAPLGIKLLLEVTAEQTGNEAHCGFGRDHPEFWIGTGGHLNGALHVAFTAPSRDRSEEHTSELQSLMRTSYAVFCLKKK